MKIVSVAEMREIDRLSSECSGIPSLTLMENAGAAVADFIRSDYPAATIAVICGKGNNGGDGFVVARKLHEDGREVRVLLLAEPSELRGDAAAMYSKLPVTAVTAKSPEALNRADALAVFDGDVLVDAILGTGFRPPVSNLYADAIVKMNASKGPVVAVDIPSGADADARGEQTGVIARADAIVTFTAPRLAHVSGNLTSGSIVVAPIGSPDAAIVSSLNLNVITAGDVAPLIGPRKPNSNKGNFGHVLVVGGSRGKAGAAAMAGMAALRAGAGLSTVATASSAMATVAGFHPELMTEELAETGAGSISSSALSQAGEIAKRKSVLAIGPGISRHPETSEFVRELIRLISASRQSKESILIVLDADGLNAFEGRTNELKIARTADPKIGAMVITPHPGEMARLIGCSITEVQEHRESVARNFAAEHNVVVVLKGRRTLIADPDGAVWVNTTGNPGMATGGTGDILTGMVAGFMAQNPTRIFDSVIAAVHLHGMAGDVARESVGEHSLVATDLLQFLPEAFRRVRAAAKERFVTISIGV